MTPRRILYVGIVLGAIPTMVGTFWFARGSPTEENLALGMGLTLLGISIFGGSYVTAWIVASRSSEAGTDTEPAAGE